MILFITFTPDSIAPHAPTHAALESLGPSLRATSTAWLLSTRRSPSEVVSVLHQQIDPSRLVSVDPLTADHLELLSYNAWSWLVSQRTAA